MVPFAAIIIAILDRHAAALKAELLKAQSTWIPGSYFLLVKHNNHDTIEVEADQAFKAYTPKKFGAFTVRFTEHKSS